MVGAPIDARRELAVNLAHEVADALDTSRATPAVATTDLTGPTPA
jgi:hypothetical protein